MGGVITSRAIAGRHGRVFFQKRKPVAVVTEALGRFQVRIAGRKFALAETADMEDRYFNNGRKHSPVAFFGSMDEAEAEIVGYLRRRRTNRALDPLYVAEVEGDERVHT
jgi:hypothetical protein